MSYHIGEEFCLPTAVSIRVDDVGWFEGADDRWCGRPSRSGLARRHVPEDILVLNEIGRGLGTRVLANLVLGEWDIKNRLRGVPHETWDEAGWDAASVIAKNRDFFDGAFSALEDSEYIEYGLHGLLHGYYEGGKLISEAYTYPHVVKNAQGQTVRLPRDYGEFDRMLTLFQEIYADWGFKKQIRVWETGNGSYGRPEDDFNRELARILISHGIGVWEWGCWPEDVTAQDGMIFLNSALGFVTWNAYDVDPDILHDVFKSPRGHGVVPNICGHLTNFIRFQPAKNMEYVPAWINYFRRVTAPFGAMLAADNEQSASQAVYTRYAALDTIDGGIRIDLSGVDAVRTPIVTDDFFVALRTRALPASCTGGRISVHECKGDHTIYRIDRDGTDEVRILM